MPNVPKMASLISLQYLKKEGRDEVDFLHADNIKLSYRLMPLILMVLAQPVQIIQDIKFAKYLQYFKEEARNEYHSHTQIDTIIFDGCSQACLKYSK